MPEIRVVNVSSELLSRLDALQAQTSFKDRSSFVIEILNEYCLYHDKYYIHSLPDTTRILVEDTLKKGAKNIDDQLQYTLKTNQRCEKLLQQLIDVLTGSEDEME